MPHIPPAAPSPCRCRLGPPRVCGARRRDPRRAAEAVADVSVSFVVVKGGFALEQRASGGADEELGERCRGGARLLLGCPLLLLLVLGAAPLFWRRVGGCCCRCASNSNSLRSSLVALPPPPPRRCRLCQRFLRHCSCFRCSRGRGAAEAESEPRRVVVEVEGRRRGPGLKKKYTTLLFYFFFFAFCPTFVVPSAHRHARVVPRPFLVDCRSLFCLGPVCGSGPLFSL